MDFIIKSVQDVSEDIIFSINKKGGLYDENIITDPFYSNLFNNVTTHFSHLTKLTMQRYYSESDRMLKYGIINSGKIGGFACVGKQKIDFIGINFGTISMISAIFTRMMSNPNIFPEIGDPNLEKNTDKTPYIPEEEDFKVFSPCQPICPIRRLFSMHLIMTGLDFIFGHEITHITNGHFGIINKINIPNQNANHPQLSILEKQALERDADYGAIEWTLIFSELVRGWRSELKVEDNEPLGISWRKFYETESDTMKYCFMTSYLTLRMHAPDYWNPNLQLQKCQPLPSYRMALLMYAYCCALSDFNEEEFEQSRFKIYEWCIESEQAFADFLDYSGKGEINTDAIRHFFLMGENYNAKVEEVYKKLAGELAGYAMHEVLPKKTSDYVVMKGLQRDIIFILEGKVNEENPNQINMLCFIKNESRVSCMPFPLCFYPEFNGDLLNKALVSDGINYAVSTESLSLSELEIVELSSIRNCTPLLTFALENSNCLKLKREILELQRTD
ncbi:hypothetical protein [Serratia fonticola]|uniref:hypothetical protein n=1 Tax=Serratia fonticola TaxID=47917 RepID=UPI00192A96A1|nr:hypothetical protein [Serratia fonticola]MBL5904415.1 hypothetical protein [Serratia fonticola]